MIEEEEHVPAPAERRCACRRSGCRRRGRELLVVRDVADDRRDPRAGEQLPAAREAERALVAHLEKSSRKPIAPQRDACTKSTVSAGDRVAARGAGTATAIATRSAGRPSSASPASRRAGRALLADLLAELAPAQEADEARPGDDRDQQRDDAGDEDVGPLAVTVASALGDALESDRARALDEHDSRRGGAVRRSSASRRLDVRRRHVAPRRVRSAASGADRDDHVDAELARARGRSPRGRPRLAVRRARPSRRARRRVRRPAARSEMLERRAHRDRVRVVGVVDRAGRRRGAAAPRRQSANATSRRPRPGSSGRPSARHARERGERVLARGGARVKSTSIVPSEVETTAPAPRARTPSSARRSPNADDLEVAAARPEKLGGHDRGAAGRQRRRSARPSRAATPSTVPTSSRCTGPIVRDHADVGPRERAELGDLAEPAHRRARRCRPRCPARARQSVSGTPSSLL